MRTVIQVTPLGKFGVLLQELHVESCVGKPGESLTIPFDQIESVIAALKKADPGVGRRPFPPSGGSG